VHDIKNSVQTYKHDNLTTTECPTCGKFMIKVKNKEWADASMPRSFL